MPEPTFYKLELEQDAYGSAVISLPDELCHDMALQPNERFDVEVEGDGYDGFEWFKARNAQRGSA